MPEAEGARPPLQTERIVATLDRHGVEYVLIGGLAAVAYGSAIPTTDLDLVPTGSRSNLDRLAGALRELEARLRVPDLAYPSRWPSTPTPSTPPPRPPSVLRPDAPGPRRHFTYDELNARRTVDRPSG